MIKSPCIRVCALNKENWCVGCGMTVRDLRIWSSVDEEEQRRIVKESRERVRLQELRDDDLLQDD